MGWWSKCLYKSFWIACDNHLEKIHDQHTQWTIFLKTQFHQQCDYIFEFHTSKKINESILLKNWPNNESNKKDDAYEILAFTYNQEMDQLML
jgi:hypothetical protein